MRGKSRWEIQVCPADRSIFGRGYKLELRIFFRLRTCLLVAETDSPDDKKTGGISQKKNADRSSQPTHITALKCQNIF